VVSRRRINKRGDAKKEAQPPLKGRNQKRSTSSKDSGIQGIAATEKVLGEVGGGGGVGPKPEGLVMWPTGTKKWWRERMHTGRENQGEWEKVWDRPRENRQNHDQRVVSEKHT